MPVNVRQIKHGELVYYRFSQYDVFPEVVHGIFTRLGGISQPPYHSLNLSFSVGDQPQQVLHNRQLVRAALGMPELLSMGQVHGNHALVISSRERPSGQPEPPGIDILLTNVPGLALMVKQADCQAVLFYDPEQQVIANVHCGWRGNVQNVLGQAVHLLAQTFGSRPEVLRVGISPSLGPCCAEFVNYRQEFPQDFWAYQTRPSYFDLWRLSQDQLQGAGVLPDHIQLAGLCSRCRAAEFFSYRRDQHTGRNATVIALRPDRK
ncbi:MAG: peptidoglycan editing factor PgeF [Desulfobacteraceae bacterium]